MYMVIGREREIEREGEREKERERGMQAMWGPKRHCAPHRVPRTGIELPCGAPSTPLHLQQSVYHAIPEKASAHFHEAAPTPPSRPLFFSLRSLTLAGGCCPRLSLPLYLSDNDGDDVNTINNKVTSLFASFLTKLRLSGDGQRLWCVPQVSPLKDSKKMGT